MRYGIIELTQGNLDSKQIYLASIDDLFPAAAMGGSSEADVASVLLEVHYGIGEPVKTDIAGDKKIFRRHAWVGEFFAAHDLAAGDGIAIEETGPNRYHVYPLRRQLGE